MLLSICLSPWSLVGLWTQHNLGINELISLFRLCVSWLSMNDAFYKKFISNADVLANHFALNATMTLGSHEGVYFLPIWVCLHFQRALARTSEARRGNQPGQKDILCGPSTLDRTAPRVSRASNETYPESSAHSWIGPRPPLPGQKSVGSSGWFPGFLQLTDPL